MTKPIPASATDMIVRFGKAYSTSLIADDFFQIDLGVLNEKWKFLPDGTIRPVREATWAIARPTSSVVGPPTYDDVVDAIKNDPDFGPILDCLVGDQFSQMIFTVDTVISRATEGLAVRRGLSEPEIRANVETLRADLRAPVRTSTVLVPTPGLKSHVFPVVVEQGMELDRFTEEEVTVCARAGALKSPFHGLDLLRPDDCVGIRISFQLPTRVTPQGVDPAERVKEMESQLSSPHRFGERSPARFAETVEDVLCILRIALKGYVRADGAVMYRPPGAYSWSTRPTPPFKASDAVIDETASEAIVSLWKMARSSRGRKLPSICLRRFNAAVDRFSLEDAVIDHLIAAEGLLLRDAGGASDRGELKFRLSVRGALLLRDTREPLATYKFLKAAYDLRSTVAHGAILPEEVRIAGRGNVRMADFLKELEDLMRDLLRLAVERYVGTAAFGSTDYWDALLFDAGSSLGAIGDDG